MKKFISIWSVLAVLSAAVAIDFYIAIHENTNPTGEQIMCAGFFIVIFAAFAFVCIGAHIENYNDNKRKKEIEDTIQMYNTFEYLKGKSYDELKQSK